MQRRTLLAAGSALFTTTLAGCGGNGGNSGNGGGNGGNDDNGGDGTGNGNGNDNTDTDTETENDEGGNGGGEPSEAGELSAVGDNTDWLENSASFSGSGQTVTDAFQAQRFTTFTYEHSGESNFIVELINDDSGESTDILVNKIGQTSGTTGIGLGDGNYVMDVDADGDWSIEVGEPAAPDGEYGVPPASITGEGSDVYGEVEIDGRATVSGSHDGSENFIVEAWEEANTSGFPDELIFNEIGSHEGETSVQLSGVYYIAVQADGSYEISIE